MLFDQYKRSYSLSMDWLLRTCKLGTLLLVTCTDNFVKVCSFTIKLFIQYLSPDLYRVEMLNIVSLFIVS
jgi:hypothetical protein